MKRTLTCCCFLLAFVTSGAHQRVADIELSGLIEPRRIVHLSAAVDGILETVTLERGDLVEKDQVVATLESSVERSTLEIAKARAEMVAELKQRQATLDLVNRRNASDEKMFQQGNISEMEIWESRANKKLAEAGVLQVEENMRLNELERQRAQALLDLRTIRSPITGVVVERLLSPGELVNESQIQIVTLAQIDPLSVEVIVPVGMRKTVAVGMGAAVTPEEPYRGGQPLAAEVDVVDRVVDAASGTFRVRLKLPNPDNQLPAGLKCKVRFLH